MMYGEYEGAFHQNRSIITLIIKNIEICVEDELLWEVKKYVKERR